MKRKEAKKGECAKCGKYFYVHAHHVKPKAGFGDSDETVLLCPNCHTHVHEYMNLHLKDPENEQEVLKVWDHWFNIVKVTCLILILLYSFFY